MITLIWAEGTVCTQDEDDYREYPRVIGVNGNMPWINDDNDLKLFRAITTGHRVIMGRKTWSTLAINPRYRFLADRQLHVITSMTPSEFAAYNLNRPIREVEAGCYTTQVYRGTAEDVRMTAVRDHQTEWFVAGGAETYDYFMPYATKLMVSTRLEPVVCNIEPGTLRDAPEIDRNRFELVSTLPFNGDNWQLRTFMLRPEHRKYVG